MRMLEHVTAGVSWSLGQLHILLPLDSECTHFLGPGPELESIELRVMHWGSQMEEVDAEHELASEALLSTSPARSQWSKNVRVLPLRHSQSGGSGLWRTSSIRYFTQYGDTWQSALFNILSQLFPCLVWISEYNVRDDMKADILAGITVGIMLVPQSMSYARLANLHSIYGLYAGFVPVFAYVIFGTSRQLAVGPVALVSLLVSNGLLKIVDPVVTPTEEAQMEYVELALQLALIVGLLEFLLGIFRMGWLLRFISDSVVSGFTSGAAIIIGLSQASEFLGYELSRSSRLIPIVQSIVAGRDNFKWQPLTLGCFFLILLLVMKQVGKKNANLRMIRAAGPCTAVALGTLVVLVFHPSSIKVVGEIPSGLPPVTIPHSLRNWERLLPTAAVITGVAVLESVGIAKALAAKNGYELNSNQELIGLGLSNIFGSMFSAYPTTGSFSRSAVNNDTGAKTGLAGLVMASMQCVLAAIVISAIMGLIDYDEAFFLWRVGKRDFALWVAAFTGTLLLGIEIGVLVAVGLSLVFVIYESANPHMAVLGRLPGTTVYRNIAQYPDAMTYSGIVVLRIDAPIYFANINYIKDRLREYTCRKQPVDAAVQFVVIEMSPVTYIDSTAIHCLKELHSEYAARGIQLALSNPSQKVMRTLAKAGIPDLIGRDWYFVRVHDAVQVSISCLRQGSRSQSFERGESPAWERQYINSLKDGGQSSSPHVVNDQ
eukprot:SM000104S09373  [mRNA]  locus=s104:408358:413764:- [translate_table: standard]